MSRDMDVMIGRIMTASTTATVATVRGGFAAGPRKSGIHPRYAATHFQNGAMAGTRTMPPHSP